MKKIILPMVFLAINTSITAQAAVGLSFAEQLMMQQTQLRQHDFNFFSDRYKQVAAQKNVSQGLLIAADAKTPSFKAQLDDQKKQLRMHKFNPISDAYFQIQAH